MTTSRVLLIDPAGLTAYRCRRGEVAPEGRFGPCDMAAFHVFLEQHTGDIFHVLVDSGDEAFRLDHLPHVARRSRRAMVARKLVQYFEDTPFAAAIPQGRTTEGRRDDRVLFAALTAPQVLEPWLQAMEDAETALAGVHSLPQVLARFAADRSTACTLLATLGNGGLRQTLLIDGRLRFSRLTALADAADAPTACADEAANLHRYLYAQRIIDRNVPLRVLVLAHPDQISDFQAHCSDTEELRFECLDLQEHAKRRGLVASLPDSRSDALFVHLLARSRPREQFAPAPRRRYWRWRRMRRALDGVGLAALAAALMFAALQLPGILRIRDHAASLHAANEAEERRYRNVDAPTPKLALPAERLREVLAAYDQLARTSPGPGPLYRRLGEVMNDFPAIKLDRLDWSMAEEFEQASGPFAILDVHGTLPPESERRNGSAGIDAFAERLRIDPAVAVRLLKSPFVVESNQAITSADAARDDRGFLLRIVQKL